MKILKSILQLLVAFVVIGILGIVFGLIFRPKPETLPVIEDVIKVTHYVVPEIDLKSYAPGATAMRALQAALRAEKEEADEQDEDDDPPTPEERAQKRWEAVVEAFTDELAPAVTFTNEDDEEEEETFYPEVTETDRRLARDLFNTLTEEQQIDETHHAMNLLPDETVSLMFDILFDKTQNEDVIDIIFSDILNRDESIKNPVMEEIAKDPTHPMFDEATRILDIVRDDPDEDE